MSGTHADISEHKNAEAALRASEAQYRSLVVNIPGAAYQCAMDENWTVLYISDAIEGLTGYPATDFIGNAVRSYASVIHPEDTLLGNQAMLDAISADEPWTIEYRICHRDGSVRWVFEKGRAMRDENGDIVCLSGFLHDITERKRMERMKDEFVSTVSHELRTPLTSISGALGLLAGGASGELPAQARQMLDIAHNNSQRLTHLINDLLDMEKLVAGKLRFDLQVQELMPLVEQALEATRAYGDQYQVRFELIERADAVQVRVDGMRLQQVLSNFLSNAAKFSPRGGQVEIAVRQRQGSVRIEVIDHGPGVPAEFRSRIFQKFSQADASDSRQKGGTGLGLAISKELIECMNGLVGFDSETGQGARFYCEFPVWEAHAAQLPPTDERDIHGTQRLLVVEDEPDIAQLLAMLLRRAGYSVDVALTGEAALACLAQNEYAAMTLDLMLPDHNGVALIRRIRSQAETLALPIIVVSADCDDGRLAIKGEFTAIDWLNKPIEEGYLIDAVRRALPRQSASKPRVLHVEDDVDLHRIVATIGSDVADFDVAHSLAEARQKLGLERYSLVVLDIGLPDGSGWDLLPLLNALDPEPPVIVLSGKEPTQAQRRAVASALLKTRTSNQDLLDSLSRLLARRRSDTGAREP